MTKPCVSPGEPLTADQLAEVHRVRDEWMQIGLSTERCDRPAAEAAVRSAYRAAGLDEPPVIVWMDSPLGGVFAAAAIKDLMQQGNTGQLRGQLGGQLWDQLRGQLGDQLGGQLWGQFWDQLRDQLRGQLGDQLRGQLGGQLGRELSPWYDAYWLAYYTCALPLAALENSPRLDALSEANRLCGWWWPMRGAAILTDRPTVLSLDQQTRYHAESGPALAYADGYTLYSWHGTGVPADLVEVGWSVAQIMAEENAEIRRCAIERMGWDQFVDAAGLKLADESDDPGNPGQRLRLFDVPRNVLEWPVRVLVAHNATRERDGSRHTFGLTVPTDCRTAVAAAAWSFGLTDREYADLARAT